MMLAGNTPMAEIRYRYEGREDCIYAKLEYYNPSGSIKDRVAEYIVEQAAARGELRKGQPIVEVTSGNTGIAFAAVGAREGYPVHIFMPEWASEERKSLMRMYGAVLHEVTREEGGFLAAFGKADELAAETGAYLPKQFENNDNVLAHRSTAAEILRQVPDVTDFVSGIGTGGTLMGVARGIRTQRPGQKLTLNALEPDMLPLLSKGIVLGTHKIEGIGDDFIPAIVAKDEIDSIMEINDDDAVMMAARLGKELGLGVGISAGCNFLGSVLAAEKGGRKVVTVFADDSKKYLSTALANPAPMNDSMVSSGIELLDLRLIR